MPRGAQDLAHARAEGTAAQGTAGAPGAHGPETAWRWAIGLRLLKMKWWRGLWLMYHILISIEFISIYYSLSLYIYIHTHIIRNLWHVVLMSRGWCMNIAWTCWACPVHQWSSYNVDGSFGIDEQTPKLLGFLGYVQIGVIIYPQLLGGLGGYK